MVNFFILNKVDLFNYYGLIFALVILSIDQ